MNIKRLKLLILLLIFGSSILARTGQEVFDVLSTEDGLSSSVVTCILKDHKGFMWFGTQNGLNRYDGYIFVKYFHSDTLPHALSGNFIRTIYEDAIGNLWIGTEKNGLNRYDRKLDRFDRIKLLDHPAQNKNCRYQNHE